MRVLFMMPSFRAYSEVWMARMLRALGEDVALVAAEGASAEPSGKGVELFASARGRRVLARVPPLRPWLFRYGALATEARRRGVDRVLCHYATLADDYLPFFRRLGVPAFVHVHGYDVFPDLIRPEGGRVHPPDYLARLLAVGREAHLIANSDFTRNHLIRLGVAPGQITTKYLGVEVPDAMRAAEPPLPLRIASVGRFVDFKSPDRTIQAFLRAVDRGLDATLTIAGRGPLLERCRELAAASPHAPRINLPGVLSPEEVQALLAGAHIYTQHNMTGETTGQQEAFGVSVIEAMSAGVPVVGTRSGAVTETVVHGETGLMVEPGDVEAHAEALLSLAADAELRVRLGQNGWRRCREHFTSEGEGRRLREILA